MSKQDASADFERQSRNTKGRTKSTRRRKSAKLSTPKHRSYGSGMGARQGYGGY